jgi:hypothetical protein
LNLLRMNGAQGQKQSEHAAIFTARFMNGLVTNRNPLRGGNLGVIYSDFYKIGATDALIDGLNTELSIRLTLIRRPGNPAYSSASIASIPDQFYSFQESTGNILVIMDTAADVEVLTPSSSTSIFTKTIGAGEGYFSGVAQSLYVSDGIDFVKYIPSAPNPTTPGKFVWNMQGAAPANAPTLTVTETGSAGVAWAAATFFSTMGLCLDGNGNIEFLTSTMQNGNATQFGETGNGGPNFSLVTGGTTVDNTCTWTCAGTLSLWTPGTTYTSQQVIWDPTTNWCFVSSGGKSGNTRPPFNPTINTSTADANGMVWAAIGPPQLWKPSTTYNSYWEFINNFVVYPVLPSTATFAAGTTIYVQENNISTVGHVNTPGTSGTGYVPVWSTIVQGTTADNDNSWVNLGSKNWAAFTNYSAWSAGSTNFNALVDGNGNFQVCLVTGSSQGTIPYNGWIKSTVFPTGSVIAVRNIASPTGYTAFQNEGASGTSGSSEPTWNFVFAHTTDNTIVWTLLGPTTVGRPVWGQTYGAQTIDGTVTWVCVGSAANSGWVKNTSWYLPATGFAPPSSSQPYGGAAVVGSSYNQFCIQSGLSQTPGPPSWSATIGNTTTDGTVIWTNVSAFSAPGATWTTSRGYVFCFKARGANDAYVTQSPPLQTAGVNSPNPIGPLGPPTGAGDNSITTASPVATLIGAQVSGAQVTISGIGSTDPQYDTIEVYRSADGFATSGPYLLLTDLPMPPVVNGVAGTWSIIDFVPDLPEVINGITLPGLNELIVAPIDHANDPPAGAYGSLYFTPASTNTPTIAAAGTGMLGITYHQGRLFGFIGTNVYASGGPETTTGNGFTAWPPTYVFPFQSPVTRIVSTSAGLLVFCTTGLYFIGGGPAITSYYSQLLVPDLGLISWNALCLWGGTPIIFSADNQLLQVEPNSGISRIGHNIGDIFSGQPVLAGGQTVQFSPAKVYLTTHSNGDADHAIFIGDGVGHWFRCDPQLAPDAGLTGPIFSPIALINGGNIKAIASVVTAPGIRTLLIGDSRANQKVLYRDSSFTTFTDNGNAYESYWTAGAVVLANPGEMCKVNFHEFDFVKIGTQPNVLVLYDELVNSLTVNEFEQVGVYSIQDPPKIYGPEGQALTCWKPRFYAAQTTAANQGEAPNPAWCRWINIKCDYGTNTVMNECLSFTIYGSLFVEK